MVDDILIYSPPEIDIVYIINISTIKVLYFFNIRSFYYISMYKLTTKYLNANVYWECFPKMYVNISTIEKECWLFIYKLCFLC